MFNYKQTPPSTWPQHAPKTEPEPNKTQQTQPVGLSMQGLENYIKTVEGYVNDTQHDPLICASLFETKTELCVLKYTIIQDKMVLPEHAKQFCTLIDRAELLVYKSGIFGD